MADEPNSGEIVLRGSMDGRHFTIDAWFTNGSRLQRIVVHSKPLRDYWVKRYMEWGILGRIEVQDGLPADHRCNGYCGGLPGGTVQL